MQEAVVLAARAAVAPVAAQVGRVAQAAREEVVVAQVAREADVAAAAVAAADRLGHQDRAPGRSPLLGHQMTSSCAPAAGT